MSISPERHAEVLVTVAEQALRRGILMASQNGFVAEDIIDCAEIAVAVGRAEIARALYELAFVRSGFAAAQSDIQRAAAQRTGFWPIENDGARPDRQGRFSVDIATAELKALVAQDRMVTPVMSENVPVGGDRPDEASQGWTAGSELRTHCRVLPNVASGISDPAARARFAYSVTPPAQTVFDACHALYTWLRVPSIDDARDELSAVLTRMRPEFADVERFDVTEAHDDIERLATVFVAAGLRNFLRTNYDLVYGCEYPDLFFASARLDTSGLGPYLRNVSNIVRSGRDIFGLVQLATGGAPEDETLERWAVLLAVHLDNETLCALVDDLADLGRTQPLWPLLSATIRKAEFDRDHGSLWRIRDAALDCGDFRLAACAQRLIADLNFRSKIEWSILGDIYCTAGNVDEAVRSYRLGQQLSHDREFFASRLVAIDAGDLTSLIVDGGYGTPLYRKRLRFVRRTSGQSRDAP